MTKRQEGAAELGPHAAADKPLETRPGIVNFDSAAQNRQITKSPNHQIAKSPNLRGFPRVERFAEAGVMGRSSEVS